MFAVIVLGYLLLGLGNDSRIIPSHLLNTPSPTKLMQTFVDEGVRIDRDALYDPDHFKLVNIFASWCLPCRAEHPILMELADQNGLKLYGINWKDTTENAVKFLNELGDPYDAIAFDGDGLDSIDWGVYGVPESFLINKDGVIIFKHIGPLTQEIVKSSIYPHIR